MASIELRGVSKSFDGVPVLQDVSVSVPDGRFAVLLGPSGCGKSTALRLVAGLESPDAGEILIGGASVSRVGPRERDVAMVFQDYALYPHLTVFENVAFGLRARGAPAAELERAVAESARLAGISDLLGRRPAQLSGGQRQRAALARAIARKPRAFLFDEPLSNLDAKLRGSMRAELKRLHKALKTTCLYVTHDQTEAMTLGEQVILLNKGRVEQQGAPRELYFEPQSRFAAEFLGAIPMNFISGRVEGGAFVAADGTVLRLPESVRPEPGAQALGLRPEHLAFVPGPDHFDSGLTAEIEFGEFNGGDWVVDLDWKGVKLRALSKSEVAPGEKTRLYFHKKWLYLY